MTDTQVTNNRAILSAALPSSVDMSAVAGGMHVSGGSSADIRHTVIARNDLHMTNTVGDATAFSGGLHLDVQADLIDDVIAHNTVSAATLPGSVGNAEADSGAGELARR